MSKPAKKGIKTKFQHLINRLRHKWYGKTTDPFGILQQARLIAKYEQNEDWTMVCDIEEANLWLTREPENGISLLSKAVNHSTPDLDPALLAQAYGNLALALLPDATGLEYLRLAISTLHSSGRQSSCIRYLLVLGEQLLGLPHVNQTEVRAIAEICLELIEGDESGRQDYDEFCRSALLYAAVAESDDEFQNSVRVLEQGIYSRWGRRNCGDVDHVWHKLGDYYLAAGKLSDAKECYRQLLDRYSFCSKESIGRQNKVWLLLKLSMVYVEEGHLQLALETVQKASKLCQELHLDAPGELSTWINLQIALTLTQLEQTAAARTLLESCVNQSLPSSEIQLRALEGLAVVATIQGSLQEALSLQSRAHSQRQAKQITDRRRLAQSFGYLGNLLSAIRPTEQARALIQHAVDSLPQDRTDTHRKNRAKLTHYLAMHFWSCEDFPSAKIHFLEALSLAAVIESRVLLMQVLRDFGSFLQQRDARSEQHIYLNMLRILENEQTNQFARERCVIERIDGWRDRAQPFRPRAKFESQMKLLPSLEPEERNKVIVQLINSDCSQVEIARYSGLSKQRISQIVKDPTVRCRPKSKAREKESAEMEDPYVQSLPLSARVRTSLRAAGIKTLSALQSLSDDELTNIKGIGATAVLELHSFLQGLQSSSEKRNNFAPRNLSQ